METQLFDLPEVKRLSPLVIRILGGNPGMFTLQGTNTYLVGTGPKRILIDTGEGKPSWLSLLSSTISSERATIEQVVITHWHHDHTGGINDLLSQCPDASVYKHKPTAGQLDISDGQIFHTQGATLHAFHCPGHMVDHTAFVLEEEDAMFTGDNVLGQGTSVFEDLTAYLDSLSQMEKQFRGRAYPGHGSVISDGPGRIRDYIAHRKQREDEILQILRGAKPGNDTNNPATPESWTPRELVQVIYKDVPKELYDRAEKGVVQVLHKLQLEGRVVEVDNGRRCKIADTATNRVSL